MIDILFFIFLTIFFIFKLKNILGTRDNDSEARQKTIDNFLKQQHEAKNINNAQVIDITEKLKNNLKFDLDLGFDISTNLKTILIKIKFDKKNFLKGVETAVEMINEAVSNKDLETLKSMLSETLFKKFEKQIDDLTKQNQIIKYSIISFQSNELENIRIYGNNIIAEVALAMEQINFVENDKGVVVAGSKKKIETIKEKWIFERNIDSKSNFWIVKNIENIK